MNKMICVVGAGKWGMNHVRTLNEIGALGAVVDQNIELHQNLDQISSIGLPVLVGTSRKSFLGKIADGASISDREEVSMASVVVSKEKGAKLFRVHDAVAVKNLLGFIEKLS